MPRLTFRSKLLLAMMLVVAGVSVATLLMTQRRVQQNYERMYRQQFERQVGYFTALQDARLASVKEECLKLAESVRIVAALQEPEIDTTLLYQAADNELRGVLNEFRDEGRPAPPGRGPKGPMASFYRFVDAAGKPLSAPDTLGGRRFAQALKRRLEQRLALVRDALSSTEPQQVAYLPVILQTNQLDMPRAGLARGRPAPEDKADTGDTPTLQEIIVTKVIDHAEHRTLGALVLGFPLPDLVPQLKSSSPRNAALTNESELIQTGILIEERLYANPSVIAPALGTLVARTITERLSRSGENKADFGCEIQGAPYRIFFELMNEHSAFPAAYQVCLYPMARAQREQADLRWKVLGSGAVALGVALLLSLAISHGLSAPIRDLVAGTGEIRQGNFQVRVPVRSGDEVGQLATAFNEMVEGLAQKEKYRTVLNMVADEKVAQQLIEGRLALGGELREITVLFCDIRGFTALTQNMPPGDVIEMLNEHMTALNRAVKAHHGVLDKFVGDLLMAIFGAPLSHGNDALNAARCALRLIEVREELNRTSRHTLQIGLGLATGPMVAGCMGSADRLNYTVLGERVNLASRLCDRAQAGEVLIDENTRQQLGEAIQAEPTGNIELKGFANPVAAFRLVGINR